jgi:hypothetical protein
MSNGAAAGGASGASAAAAAIANAIKASGVLVRVEEDEFRKIIQRIDKPLIVCAGPAFFSPGHKYLTSYKGLAFYTKSTNPLHLPGDAETIIARKIHIPG